MSKKILQALFALFISQSTTAQQNNTFLWRINNPLNENHSYLFGTIHLPQKRFMMQSDSLYQAIKYCDLFYNEVDYKGMFKEMRKADSFLLAKKNYLDSAKKTPAWKKLIGNINKAYNANIDPDHYEQLNKFQEKILADYIKSDPGVKALDMALADYATAIGKPTKGLETFVLQIDMIYKIIDARLTDTTLLFNDDIALAANMKQFYEKQLFDSLTYLIEGLNNTYKKILFDDRNISMADSIQQISENNSAFFAVGCGHLLGKTGIINLLKAKGLTLTPVFSDNKFSVILLQSIIDAAQEKTVKEELISKAPIEYLQPEEISADAKMEELPPPPPPPPLLLPQKTTKVKQY
ncbi:TraB/GumN family protein [Ferruginibacter sp. SUN002]|uniref:TraB/GumN family protein n=1 Tax=Ferruginibacter sp. SUN002 TaxID=2937789 RepID=UPI003D369D77